MTRLTPDILFFFHPLSLALVWCELTVNEHAYYHTQHINTSRLFVFERQWHHKDWCEKAWKILLQDFGYSVAGCNEFEQFKKNVGMLNQIENWHYVQNICYQMNGKVQWKTSRPPSKFRWSSVSEFLRAYMRYDIKRYMVRMRERDLPADKSGIMTGCFQTESYRWISNRHL